MIYMPDVVNVLQDKRAPAGGGGTDNDIAAAQKLLNQGTMAAHTTDIGKLDFAVEGMEHAALAGDGIAGNRVKLTVP